MKIQIASIVTVVVLSLIGVCSFNGDELFGDEDKKDSNDKKNWGDDDVKKADFPKTAFEYAKMCESELGVPPRVNLDKSVEIPVYVNGVQTYGEFFSCDNPALIGKGTVSGSTLQRYEGRTVDGKPLPDVIWVAFGRNNSSSHKHVVGSVQMIGPVVRPGDYQT